MDNLYNAIFKGLAPVAKTSVQEALDSGKTPQEIIDDSMIPAMEAIGREFEAGRVFVPNLLLSARAMKGALDILKPLMMAGQTTTLGTVVIGTVKGDLHDIGKNLVASMLEGRGFKVINLGTDVSKERFIEAAKENEADIICLSALLTTTMDYMKDIVDAVRESGLNVKIMVGGAPLTSDFASGIGADGYSSNANEAVAVAKQLVAV
ncbi:MAG: corrinoid protein [Bacteroidales bacterium]|nr:corrinoid protein [Bacteroidales bacterium]